MWITNNVLIQLSTMFTVQSQGFSNNKAAPVSSGSALSGPADMSASWDLSGQPDSAVDQQYSVSQHAHLGTVDLLCRNDIFLHLC